MASEAGRRNRKRHRRVRFDESERGVGRRKRGRVLAILAIFDSGLGGLTVLRELRKRLPDVDVIYFADHAHVPYGDRAPEELYALMERNVRSLEHLGATALVMGCNTSCAVAARFGWPQTVMPILDLIESAAVDVALSNPERIGILATNATAASGAYGRAIRARSPRTEIIEIGNAELVPLAEAAQLTGEIAASAAARAVAPFPPDLDALVLACTHFPLFDAHFASALGEGVRRIDPAVAQADRAMVLATARKIDGGTATTHYITTGDAGAVERSLHAVGALGPTDTLREQAPLATRR